ncbi:MAG: hypothetical protein A2017_03610 [Lentisphaerae bacterium GWF2_44_16]|nr:MAG: hypothetical protein A2017_03610 [Lentisphaerae bacterium GWF2_44_16]
MFALIVLSFMAASVSSSDPAVDIIMKQREVEIRKAAQNYEVQVLQADGRALKQLSALLKSRKDAESLRSVKKAIARIEERPARAPVASDADRRKIEKSSSVLSDYPDGTFARFGRHFYVFPVRMNCADAMNACSVMGGSLLKINNEEEFNYFTKRWGSGKNVFWVDMAYSQSENKWLSGRGAKIPFIKWRRGYPVSSADADSVLVDCGNSDGEMINVHGTGNVGTVICEWGK